MIGIIDIGNTHCKWGIFEGESLLQFGRTAFGDWFPIQSAHAQYRPEHWLLASVRHIPTEEELGFPFEELNLANQLPVTIAYLTPQTLGRDRLAGVCGAQVLFKNQACLVIDAGTCITFDLIDHKGVYHGGSISPGIHMRLRAMHEFTGKLPQVDWEDLAGFMGNDTRSCLLQGVKQGVLGEVGHQIEQYRTKYPNLKVIITGGDTAFFEKNMKNKIFAAPNLVLTGLNAIHLYKKSLNA